MASITQWYRLKRCPERRSFLKGMWGRSAGSARQEQRRPGWADVKPEGRNLLRRPSWLVLGLRTARSADFVGSG